MSDQQNRDTLERYFQALERGDIAAMSDLLHEDFVEEYPQSGERVRGSQNWRSIAENYPGLPSVVDHSVKVSGDLGTLEMVLEYDGNRTYSCTVVELQDGKVKRAKDYFAEPFEAPEWRAQWVERM